MLAPRRRGRGGPASRIGGKGARSTCKPHQFVVHERLYSRLSQITARLQEEAVRHFARRRRPFARRRRPFVVLSGAQPEPAMRVDGEPPEEKTPPRSGRRSSRKQAQATSYVPPGRTFMIFPG